MTICASKPATVCFLISLSICYWLFKCRVLRIVCVCVFACIHVCVWASEREKERERERVTAALLCVCVSERAREWERERERVTVAVSCVWERETRSHNHGLCANTYEHHHCVCHVTLFPSRLELMVKIRTLTVFTLVLKAEARDYGKGRYISDACLWCSANHNALCQLANQSRLCLSEAGSL